MFRRETTRSAPPHGLVTRADRRNPVKCAAMRKAALVLISLVSVALAAPAWARSPVLVELYTSQGCSSCVKSGAVLAQLPDKPPILVLTFGVDIWDYLGWSDSFAKPEFAARQKDFMARLALRDVYTPQLVIDGRYETAAVGDDKIEPLIKQAARAHGPAPQIQFDKDKVSVGSGHAPGAGAEVWLVRYEPHDQSVLVKSGDNRGQTLVEHNVVRELIRLGTWRGRPHHYDLPPPTCAGLNAVILLQVAHGGPILAVGQP